MKRVSLILVITFASFLVLGQSSSATEKPPPSLVSRIFGKTLSLLAGQRYEREEDAPAFFKELALKDDSSIAAARLTIQQLIERSGFIAETHHSIADDGYITELIRIVNPLADRHKLKQPPVMLLQGGVSDQAIWIWSSSLQHHPEKYPRLVEDGPITSWNRSLGFVLANNGYDVWLVGTRGSNEGNMGHTKLGHQQSWMDDHEPNSEHDANSVHAGEEASASQNNKKGRVTKKSKGLFERLRYWEYTLDDLANFELPRQMDTVLNITNSQKVTLVPISLSSIISIMSITANPEYKKRLHNAVVLAPIVNNQGTNKVLRSFHEGVCTLLPSELGNILYTELFFSKFSREALLQIGKHKELRYSLIKGLTLAFAGPSSKYQTFLETVVYGKLLMPTSFKQIKHYCQVVKSGKLNWYDYGPFRNMQMYGSPMPRSYNMSATDFGNWMVISAGNDMFSTPKSVQQYIRSSKTPPVKHLMIKRYNHLDLIAAVDNDKRVNLPVLKYLDVYHIPPSSSDLNHEDIAAQHSSS